MDVLWTRRVERTRGFEYLWTNEDRVAIESRAQNHRLFESNSAWSGNCRQVLRICLTRLTPYLALEGHRLGKTLRIRVVVVSLFWNGKYCRGGKSLVSG